MADDPTLTVVLTGDGPWGFRLSGGTCPGEPLTVAKVRAKSKAEGQLEEGDVVVSVNGWPCHNLSYDEVIDILDAAETELELQVVRTKEREYIAPPYEQSTRKVDKVAMETEYRTALSDAGMRTEQPKLPNADSMNELELPLAQVQKQLDDLLDNIEQASAGRQSTEPFELDEVERSERSAVVQSKLEHETSACKRVEMIVKEIEPITKVMPVRIDSAPAEAETLDGGSSLLDSQQFQEPVFERAQPPVSMAADPSFPMRDDVTRSVESEVTPEGYVHRTVTREVTSEPNKMAEVVTATAEERRGDAEIRSVLHEEASVQEFRSQGPGVPPAGFTMQAPSIVRQQAAGPPSQPSVPTFTPAATEGQMFHVSKFVSSKSESSSSTSQQPFGSALLEDGQVGSVITSSKDAIQSSQQSFSSQSSSRQVFSSSQSSTVSQSSSQVISQSTNMQQQQQPSISTSQQISSSTSSSVSQTSAIQSKQRPSSMPPLDFNILEAIEANKISLVGTENAKNKQTQQAKPSQPGKPTAVKTTKEGHMINPVSDEDSHRFQMLMKAFKPPPEDEGLSTPERKKKMFSSSSFYDEPTHRYPTMEEQVKLCKKIADSLSAEPNLASRGATMYIKRKKRSFNWITEGPDPTSSESEAYGEYDSDSMQRPQSYTDGDRPKLKLVLDPRQLQDSMKLAKTGMYNEHNVVSPDICFDLVRDLNSPTGKGAQLFAKRKKKSESWVVDENSVKEALSKQPQLPDVAPLPTSDYRFQKPQQQQHRQQQQQQQQYQYQQVSAYGPPPDNKLQEIQDRLNPKVKLVKSPWEAALESPYGSCDAAFELIKKTSAPAPLMPLPENLFHATEWMEPLPPPQPAKSYVPPPLPTTDMRMFSPRPYSPQQQAPLPRTAPQQQQQQQQQFQQPPQPPPRTVSPFGRSLYSANPPRGWAGSTTDQSQQWQQEPTLHMADFEQYTTIPEPRGESPSFNKYSLNQFGNYNNTAKAWTGGYSRPAQVGYKPVRPVSMYVK